MKQQHVEIGLVDAIIQDLPMTMTIWEEEPQQQVDEHSNRH
jgi:hypothetical protein